MSESEVGVAVTATRHASPLTSAFVIFALGKESDERLSHVAAANGRHAAIMNAKRILIPISYSLGFEART